MAKRLLVKKFGGSSLASQAHIEHVADRLAMGHKRGERQVVVASAMAHATDQLANQVASISASLDAREHAAALVTGELFSITLLAMALRKRGIQALSYNAYQLNLLAEGDYKQATLVSVDEAFLQQVLSQGIVPVVAGFQAINAKREWLTLGRNGSDTTATFLAHALKADLCDIYTDVPGVMSADPQSVPAAFLLAKIPMALMHVYAQHGANVLHPDSIHWAMQKNVPVRVRSALQEGEGTLLSEDLGPEGQIFGVCREGGFATVHFHGEMSKQHKAHFHGFDLGTVVFGDRTSVFGRLSDVLCLLTSLKKSPIHELRLESWLETDRIAVVGHFGTDRVLSDWLESWSVASQVAYFDGSFVLSLMVDQKDGDHALLRIHEQVFAKEGVL